MYMTHKNILYALYIQIKLNKYERVLKILYINENGLTKRTEIYSRYCQGISEEYQKVSLNYLVRFGNNNFLNV